jgi:hypothetical protein
MFRLSRAKRAFTEAYATRGIGGGGAAARGIPAKRHCGDGGGGYSKAGANVGAKSDGHGRGRAQPGWHVVIGMGAISSEHLLPRRRRWGASCSSGFVCGCGSFRAGGGPAGTPGNGEKHLLPQAVPGGGGGSEWWRQQGGSQRRGGSAAMQRTARGGGFLLAADIITMAPYQELACALYGRAVVSVRA